MGAATSKKEENIRMIDVKFSDLKTETSAKHQQLKTDIDKRIDDLIKNVNDIKNGMKNTHKIVDDLTTDVNANLNEMKETNKRVSVLITDVNEMKETNKRVDDLSSNLNTSLDEMKDTNKRVDDLSSNVNICVHEIKKNNKSLGKMVKVIEDVLTEMKESRKQWTFPDTTEEWFGSLGSEILSVKLDEKPIMHISKCINPERISAVGLMLKLKYEEVRKILQEYKHANNQAFEIILKWRNQIGKKRNMKKLLESLFRVGKADPKSINVEALENALKKIKGTSSA